MPSRSILIIEDSASLASLYQTYLEGAGYQVQWADSGETAISLLRRKAAAIVLLDLKLPDMDGMEILRHIRREQLPSEVIIITAHGSINTAVSAMQEGAFDFVIKPCDASRLLATVANAVKHHALQLVVESVRDDFGRTHYEGFIGESLPMQAVYRIIDSAASSSATVFITGESGTGKEVCADAIHKRSPRARNPFVALNCAAIPRELMESEIFGHIKGAFSGAHSNRLGAASLADGGTLFLDEICEMDLELQTKLLRFIQSSTFQRVGSSKLETVNVRFICATNRDPWAEVQAGRFREDLYYRLHVIPIHLPPLRERETDIKLIMEHFLVRFAREENKEFVQFSREAQSAMLGYDWPGNVRQLQNVVRNIVVLNQGREVLPAMIPPPVQRMVRETPVISATASPLNTGDIATPAVAGASDTSIKPLWLVEKDAIERAIALCDGNIPKAAALLEVSASTLYRKREKWLTDP